MVGDGCESELHLSLGSSRGYSSAESNRISGSTANSEVNQQEQQQQISIFYNGRICVCDVTEFQARAIISIAKREMDDRMKKNQLHQQQQHEYQQKNRSESSTPQPPASSSQAMPQFLNQGLSMKRSLQRFLQKRKTRIDAASPYNDRRETLHPSTSSLASAAWTSFVPYFSP